jgi:Tol biopolymer transport system component
MNANGTGRRVLAETEGAERPAPAWSPDGKWSAYVNGSDDHTEIWLVAPDGTRRHRLVVTRSWATDPAWFP